MGVYLQLSEYLMLYNTHYEFSFKTKLFVIIV